MSMIPYHLVLPMAGAGSRFKRMGYDQPKPLIPIHGKPAFYRAAQSHLLHNTPLSITAVVLQQHIVEWQIDRELKALIPAINIVVLPDLLNGPTLTCLAGIKAVPHDGNPVAFMDCDVAFQSLALNTFQSNPELMERFAQCGGMLTSFPASSPAYSYLIEDANGWVTETKEKEVVSSHAITGCYWFKDADTFETAATTYLQNCPYTEYFMSGIYNQMIADGGKVMRLPIDYHLSFGTPEEYEAVKSRSEWADFGVTGQADAA